MRSAHVRDRWPAWLSAAWVWSWMRGRLLRELWKRGTRIVRNPADEHYRNEINGALTISVLTPLTKAVPAAAGTFAGRRQGRWISVQSSDLKRVSRNARRAPSSQGAAGREQRCWGASPSPTTSGGPASCRRVVRARGCGDAARLGPTGLRTRSLWTTDLCSTDRGSTDGGAEHVRGRPSADAACGRRRPPQSATLPPGRKGRAEGRHVAL